MTDDSENWDQLQELFHLAETTDEEDRERVLTERCADPQLRRRVMAIFRGAHLDNEESPHIKEPFQTEKIGPYSLIRHLGSGGIGSVYLVERLVGGAPQRAALKILAPHAAGPSFVDRFHREQHILASMEHPNVTRMLDGGLSESGQPYLVMEYVNGVHLDVFCDEHRLGTAERLELFLQVCNAVGYAHRRLVVHLDLKPSNILVTDEGTVKLLDFGTSKLIQTDSLLTTTVMATPAYASPEQLRNEPVTTACDLYALGAILFELLAGRRPGNKASVAVMIERAMREQEPEKLTDAVTEDAAVLQGTTAIRLRQVLKGDLATIVAKCLRARPQDRYLSVDALADDLRRYLAGRPVLATPQTAMYKIRKFVRRNRKAVAASAAAALLLVATVTYAAVRQQQALREARRAIEMQAFMAQLFKLASTNYMGKPAASVPEFLKLGATVLPQMITNPADQRAGEISLAQSMYYDGDHADSEAVLRRVVADAKASGDIPAEAEAEGWAAMVAYKLGKMQDFNTLSAHALQLADKPGVTPAARVWIKTFYTQDRYELGYTTDKDVAIQHAAMMEAQGPGVPANELAYAKLNYALVSGRTSSLAKQQKLAEEAVAIYRSEPYSVCETAAAEQVLGYLQNQAQKTAESVKTFRDSYNAYQQCRGGDSHDALRAASALGGALVVAGQPQEAIALLEPTTTKLQTLMGADNLTAMFPLSALARAYVAAGQFKQGEETSIKLFHLLNGKVNSASSTMGICHLTWARALDGEGQYAEALKHAELADEEYHADGSKQLGVVRNGQLAHQLVLDLQARLNQKAR